VFSNTVFYWKLVACSNMKKQPNGLFKNIIMDRVRESNKVSAYMLC